MKVIVIEDVTPGELPEVLKQLEGHKEKEKVVVVHAREKVREEQKKYIPAPKHKKRHARHWTPEEDAKVKALWNSPSTFFASGKLKTSRVKTLAREVGKTPAAVKTRAWTLKLTGKQKPLGKQRREGPKRVIDYEAFKKDYASSMPLGEVAKKHDTSVNNCYSLASELKVKRGKSVVVKREDQHVKETPGEYMLRVHAKVPSSKPAIFIPGRIMPPQFPRLENIGVNQGDAQKSFESFCIVSKKPRQLTYSSAFALFGVASFKQWYDFLNEVMAKSEEIVAAIGVANLFKVIKMGNDAVLQYGG